MNFLKIYWGKSSKQSNSFKHLSHTSWFPILSNPSTLFRLNWLKSLPWPRTYLNRFKPSSPSKPNGRSSQSSQSSKTEHVGINRYTTPVFVILSTTIFCLLRKNLILYTTAIVVPFINKNVQDFTLHGLRQHQHENSVKDFRLIQTLVLAIVVRQPDLYVEDQKYWV